MEPYFRTHPGCWERHLQRQYNNPLFIHCATSVTQQAIQAARRLDKQEERAFERDFQKFLQDAIVLGNQVNIETALQFQERIQILYQQCAGLGGQHPIEKEGLLQLTQIIIQAIWNSGVTDAYLIDRLKQQQAYQQMQFSLLEHFLVADLLRPNSPILQEHHLIPTLLTEDEPALRAAMSLLEPQQHKIICQEARTLLTQLDNQGHDLPQGWAHLAIIEQPLYRPN